MRPMSLPGDPTSASADLPILFLFAKYLMRKRIRGGWRLLHTLNRLNLLRPTSFPLSDSVDIEVPLARVPMDLIDLKGYEADLVRMMSKAVSGLPIPVTLLDCGADIGLFSLLIVSQCSSIERIVAFEPNPEGFVWLERNLRRLPFPAEARREALSNVSGSGILRRPRDGDYTAQYFEAHQDGVVQSMTIDSLGLPEGEGLVLKLDLEGGELRALQGARRTVSAAADVIVSIEAHPDVARRTGVDPIECLRLLSDWRGCSFVAAETGTIISPDRPIFEQLRANRVYNIIGASSPIVKALSNAA